MSLPGDDAVWARLDELPSRLTAPATASSKEAYESSKEAVSLAKDDLLQIMLSTHEQLRALESDNGRPTRPFEPASAAQDTEALMAEAREYNEDLTVGEGIGWLNNDEEGYRPPTYSECLPVYLLSPTANDFVDKRIESGEFVEWNTTSLPKMCMALAISRKLGADELANITGYRDGKPTTAYPLLASWDANPAANVSQVNAPQPIWVPFLSGSRGLVFDWLGCRCSWPVSQQCWSLMVGCNIHQYVLNVWICVTLGFELFMLDALVSSAFIANCPNKVFEWEDYLIWDKPLSVTAAALLTYLIFPLFTIGYLAGKNDKRMGGSGGVDQSYFAGVWQSKILLRSMAAREEAGAYSYCTTLFYAVAMEFHCVIIPAYIPFICPALVMFQYEAALHNIAKFYIMLDVILKFGTNGLFFAWFLFCFNEGQISVTRKYVAGPRAAAEWRSMKFVYTWVSLIGTYLMIFSVKTYFTILYLWFIPLFITIFAFFGHALPYLMHGAAACPPHTGPAVELVGIATTLIFLAGFLVARGCWLFPCLCAPEVPGWLFFPPHDPPDNPLQGDVDWDAFQIFLRHMWRGFPAAEDCVWEPPTWDFSVHRGAHLPPKGSKG